MRSKGKPNTNRFEAGRDWSAKMKSVRLNASSVRKAVDSSVSALILAGPSGVSYPPGNSTLPTRSRVSRRFSFLPEKKDANPAAYDANK